VAVLKGSCCIVVEFREMTFDEGIFKLARSALNRERSKCGKVVACRQVRIQDGKLIHVESELETVLSLGRGQRRALYVFLSRVKAY
jgi:hypothetical protein